MKKLCSKIIGFSLGFTTVLSTIINLQIIKNVNTSTFDNMEPNNIMQLHTVTTDDEKYSHVRHNQIEKQSSAKLSLFSMNEPHTTTDNIGTIETDPDSTDCTELLQKFRAGEIKVAQNRNGPEGELYNYQKTFATITKTEKPFYVSTHDKPIDTVRSRIMKSQVYYERELTNRVAEVFKKKSAEGKESIMLDVGANIGEPLRMPLQLEGVVSFQSLSIIS